MNTGRKLIHVFLTVLLTVGLIACGSSEKNEPSPQAETPAAETELPEETAIAATPTPIPEKTPEPTEEPEPGHYTDPSAFEGFHAYIEGAVSSYDSFRDREVRIGETKFSETGYSVNKARQYAYGGHESVKEAEVLEAGAIGMVSTGGFTKLGGETAFLVYNPSDEPAAFEDCVILGFKFLDGATFSDGTYLTEGTQDPSVLEDIINRLGEPCEIKGTVREGYVSGTYFWRDEDGVHEFTLSVYSEGDMFEINGISYTDYSVLKGNE